MRQPIDAGGKAVFDSLFALIQGQHAAPRVLPTELVIRSSSVAPRNR